MAVAFSKIRTIIEWCFLPHHHDKKHKGWKHPIFCLFVMSMTCLLGCSYLATRLANNPSLFTEIPYKTRMRWAAFLMAYWFGMLASRILTQKSKAFYDMLWACNISILVAVYGLLKNSPILLGTSLLTVAADQLLWYVDILGYILTGKFYVGVAAYLTWPETTLTTKITASHHLWFIPLLASLIKKSGGLKKESFQVSAALTLLLWLLARAMLPKTLPGLNGNPETYMNVNLSWELWKDIKIEIVNKFLKDASYVKCMATNSVIWNSLNFLSFLLLKKFI